MFWLTFGVAVLALLVTAVIPILLYRATRKGARASAIIQKQQKELLTQQGDILKAQRLDRLAEQAGNLTGLHDLAQVLAEARQLDQSTALTRVLEAYWANPAVPLSGGGERLDSRAVRVMTQHLSSKLSGRTGSPPLTDLADFTKTAVGLGESISGAAASWLLGLYGQGRGPNNTEVRNFLRDAGDDKLFESLVFAFHGEQPAVAAKVHIVAGVAEAYLDRIGFHLSDDEPKRTGENNESRLSALVLDGMESILDRDMLRAMDCWPTDGLAIEPQYVAALVAAACGAASFTSDHLAMRSLQSISKMWTDQTGPGLHTPDAEFGRRKFKEYQPTLLQRYPF